MRIRDRFLEHRIDTARRLEIGSSIGGKFAPVDEDVPALVVDGQKLVTDQRVDSDTHGQQILSSARILVQPEAYMPPGSKVTIWKGTPMQRDAIVVATAYGQHSIAPNSAQAWVV